MTLKLGMQHWVCDYQDYSNDYLGLTLTFLGQVKLLKNGRTYISWKVLEILA